MPPLPRRLAPLLLFLLVLPRGAGAQASPYVPLDDPHLPLFEHLVARGEVEDPSPMVRPFRRAQAVTMLRRADSLGTLRDTALAARLRPTSSAAASPTGSSPTRWAACGWS